MERNARFHGMIHNAGTKYRQYQHCNPKNRYKSDIITLDLYQKGVSLVG